VKDVDFDLNQIVLITPNALSVANSQFCGKQRRQQSTFL